MVLRSERWLELRRYRVLHEAGLSLSQIARETGLDRKTVRKYLADETVPAPPQRSPRRDARTSVLSPFAHVIDAWLRAELLLKGTVIHERLVEQYGFTGNYQRVKLYLQEARPRIATEMGIGPDELAGLHRRFEVVPGAQAQVDWGDEIGILAHGGIAKVFSFHMVLSYSRDPFCCFTTSQDLSAFWECHRRAFAHFGGVPKSIVYDRTKTVVRRHVAPGQAVPLHPEAVAFAGHYDFDIDDMVRHLTAADTIGRLARKLHTYLRPNVLVIDEVGYHPLERAQANLVFQVISKRYEKGSTLLTSNKSFGEWGQVFGDEVLATAILDRLLHHCDVVAINGPSYRLKNRLTAIEGQANVA